MKTQLKLYLIGFSKGLGLFILLQLIRGLYINFLGLNLQAAFVTPGDLLIWFIGVSSIVYLVKRNKLEKGWILFGLIFAHFTYPFLFGYLEIKKGKN